jgi:hypothetical protein
MNPYGLDAVCINQANLAEREFQIAAMRSVYASASRILVWLGLASEASSRRPPLQSTPLLILNALPFHPVHARPFSSPIAIQFFFNGLPYFPLRFLRSSFSTRFAKPPAAFRLRLVCRCLRRKSSFAAFAASLPNRALGLVNRILGFRGRGWTVIV